LVKIHAGKGGDLVLEALDKEKLEELKKYLEEKHNICVYTIEKDLTLPDSINEVYDVLRTSQEKFRKRNIFKTALASTSTFAKAAVIKESYGWQSTPHTSHLMPLLSVRYN